MTSIADENRCFKKMQLCNTLFISRVQEEVVHQIHVQHVNDVQFR